MREVVVIWDERFIAASRAEMKSSGTALAGGWQTLNGPELTGGAAECLWRVQSSNVGVNTSCDYTVGIQMSPISCIGSAVQSAGRHASDCASDRQTAPR